VSFNLEELAEKGVGAGTISKLMGISVEQAKAGLLKYKDEAACI
jgi:hypothetical protein